MSEFQEVMRQWKRMCESRGKMPDDFVGAEQALLLAMESPDEIEELVMAWAAKHPEPVYPTWWSWLINERVIEKGSTYTGAFDQLKTKSIPADIAQKLGLQPKEG